MATLVIGGFYSECMECNGASANPNETGHYTQLGDSHNGEPGCGQEWTNWISVYPTTIEHILNLFPHLAGLPNNL